MSIPLVYFCGLTISRLILGANPFGGYSHQNPDRDKEMVSYYSVEKILETWAKAEKAGINTMITNNETPHVMQAVREYQAKSGALQWIAQVNMIKNPNMYRVIDDVLEIGCKALYFHGGLVDEVYFHRDEQKIRSWVNYAQSKGVKVGVAGHAPEVHYWIDSLNIVDFHCVCFFNCGSLHDGKGDKFRLEDVFKATECIRKIQKPCIGYKIMGAGRIDARMAFEYAFEHIKPSDVVNVGMYRGDKDAMVEENAAIVGELIG